MTKWFSLLLAVSMLVLATGTARAQSLEERLQKFGADYAKGYVGPFAEAFGASLNSGWYQTANVSNGLDIFVGLELMGMPVPSDAKTFVAVSPYDNVSQVVPTFAGSGDEIPISGAPAGAEPNAYAGGFNLPLTPMALPYISAGNIFGTRAIIRFLPAVNIKDIGDISIFGIGVQHSISQWVSVIPLDVSAMIGFQKFKMGSFVDASGFTFGVQGSKTLTLVTLYGGLAYETSTFSFSYTAKYTDPANPSQMKTLPVAFDVDGKNTVRATIGATLSLGFFKVNADYSFASQSVVVVGLGFGI